MRPAQFDQLVEDLRFRLAEQLVPLGWTVEARQKYMPVFGPTRLGAEVRPGAEFTLLFSVECRASLLAGKQFGHKWALTHEELTRLRREELERLADAAAEGAVLAFMRQAAASRIPAPPEVDWRPTETVPEDFHAM